MYTNRLELVRRMSFVLLLMLIALCVTWEWRLAPVRPGGSWLMIKALPLVACVWGVMRGERRVFQALSLLVWLYVLEGLTRVMGERGAAAWLSGAEVMLALALFLSVALYAKWTRGPHG